MLFIIVTAYTIELLTQALPGDMVAQELTSERAVTIHADEVAHLATVLHITQPPSDTMPHTHGTDTGKGH